MDKILGDHLEKIKGWIIAYISPDDGHTLVDSYYTNSIKAGKKCKQLNDRLSDITTYRVVPHNFWTDSQHNYYELEAKQIYPDLPSRDEVLSKLTPQDRKVLGV